MHDKNIVPMYFYIWLINDNKKKKYEEFNFRLIYKIIKWNEWII
jgi:hypothetical protein